MKYLIRLLLILSAAICNADELTLKNGELVVGTLVAVRDDTVYWHSETFGSLSIAKNKVEKMIVNEKLKLNGHDEPCTLDSFDGGMIDLSCGNRRSLVHIDMVYSIDIWKDENIRFTDLSGNVGLLGDFEWGNTNSQDWRVTGDFKYTNGNIRQTATGYFTRDNIQDDTQSLYYDKWQALYKLDWLYNEYWYLNYNLAGEADEQSNLKSRYTTGVGVGYRFWDNDKGHLFIENGPAYRNETTLDNGVANTDQLATWRYALNWQTPLWFASGPTLIHRHDIIYSHQHGSRFEFDSITGINFPVWDSLSAAINLEVDYDSAPPVANTEKTDVRLNVGLNYGW